MFTHSCVVGLSADKGVHEQGSAAGMKQYVLNNLRSSKVPTEALEVVERSEVSDATAAPLRFRSPLSLFFARISKGNVCVAGDALHPMTPDLGQGVCSALEDGVVLARCLGEAVLGDGEAGTMESALRKSLRQVPGLVALQSAGFAQKTASIHLWRQFQKRCIKWCREM
jgi:2-polyprenyl-6-methoxyphenol hydroxylase-like FAD-dependent oxidoreductase